MTRRGQKDKLKWRRRWRKQHSLANAWKHHRNDRRIWLPTSACDPKLVLKREAVGVPEREGQ